MTGEIKILILEDSAQDVVLIERELERAGISFTSLVAKNKRQFENALNEFVPDVVLSDHSLPQFNSIEAFKIFQAHQRECKVSSPFILVTGAVSEEFAVQCLKAGVDDYILKDRLKRLPLSITSALEKRRIENERMKYLEQVIAKEALMKEVEHLAHLGSWQADLLTGKHAWSDEVYLIYGYAPGEIEPDYELYLRHVHPDDLPALKKAQEYAMANLERDEYEFRIIDRQGDIKYISAKLEIFRNSEGLPIRLIGFNLDITDRKSTRIALRKSELEYTSLFDQNPDPVYSVDLEGKLTNVNKRLADLTGFSAADLSGMDLRQIVHGSDAGRVFNHFLSALEGKPQQFEAKFLDREGKTIVLDITNMPIVVYGKIVGVHGVAKDITEKKELETLLDEAYRLARVGGWEIDILTQKLSWTSITKELHEVSSDFEPELENAIRFYKEGVSRNTIRKAVEDGMKYGFPWDAELEIVTGKGNTRWVRAMGKADIRDGRCVRLYGTLQDIHERKENEETLKEAYREKVNILESIGDAFFAVDKRWTVTYWNNIAEELLQMPRQNVLGKNLWEVFQDAVPLAFYTEYHKAMNGNCAGHFEEYYAPLKKWLEVNVYPSASGLAIYFKDITDKRQHSEKIEKQNEQLKEIAWMQSHEVRAPLARIMGLVHIINKGLDRENELPGLLTNIQSSAADLDDLIRKIVRKSEEIGPKEIL